MVRQEQVSILCNVSGCMQSYSLYAGKTMTANAVANFLGKKVLLLTVSLLAERELTKVDRLSCTHDGTVLMYTVGAVTVSLQRG